jgi:hypothetical protein
MYHLSEGTPRSPRSIRLRRGEIYKLWLVAAVTCRGSAPTTYRAVSTYSMFWLYRGRSTPKKTILGCWRLMSDDVCSCRGCPTLTRAVAPRSLSPSWRLPRTRSATFNLSSDKHQHAYVLSGLKSIRLTISVALPVSRPSNTEYDHTPPRLLLLFFTFYHVFVIRLFLVSLRPHPIFSSLHDLFLHSLNDD